MEIVPVSDVVYCSHTGWQFRHAVHLRRAGTGTSGSGTTVLQKVCTGDLVAVADDTHPDITKHFRIEPWNKSKKNEQLPSWRVGQVLAIASSSSFQKNNSDNRGRNRNSSPTSSTADPFRHCAVVQWLHPMQYIQEHDKKHPDCPLVNRRELQKIQGILRPHFMLWQPPCRQGGSASTESNTNPGKEPEMQCLVDLQSILPAAATLLDCKVFQDRQLPGELAPGCFEFYFHCHFRLPYDRDGQPTECPRDDFWPTGNNQPPTTVTTGWNRFSWSDLFPGDFSRLDQQNKVVSALTASYQSLKHHKPAKERFLVVGEISKSVYPAKPKPPARELSSKRTDKTDSMATVSNDKASKKRKGTVEEPPPTRLKPKKPDVTTSRKSNVRAPLRVVEVKPNVKVTSKKTKEPAQKKIRRASIDHHVMPVSSVSAESTQRRLATRKKGQGSTEAWTTVPPLFVDHFDGIEYFSELEVNPPLESFSMEFLSAAKNHAALTWTVRLGDPVIVHSNVCSGRASYVCSARFGTSRQKISPTHFPFGVPWAVGEVVTIMRHQSADESAEIKLEIRWLYRERELGSKVRRHTEIHDFETEEVCESDHYDEIAPTSLLAPVRLYEEAQSLNDGMNYLQMPVIEFHCQRYWSVARKCLKPVGGLIGRIERGRLLSKVIGRNVALKTALSATKLQVADVLPIDVGNQIWKESFAKVVKKLSLTDASKVAFENPDRLVGREKERKEIESFLMSSLSVEYDVEMKACLFIAGPPGTGKTACVRSVISDLQRNLATKRSSGFDFVTLNGMEMRDPFESYSKLWQELKVDDARCSTSSAEKRLESFFSGKQGNERERVTVVLLDEIDYLVTKNQSVLFNFFDWPSRSRENNSKKRLVVIGISNTLNLPERLQPRVQSRIGSKRVFFQSYSVKETVEILNSKMLEASPNYAVFDPDAVLYASKKTASLSGDIRKAFQICRSAAEMVLQETNEPAETTTNPKVGIKDVLKVSREATNAAQSRFVGLCAPFEVLLLIALSSLSKTTGRECGGFDVEEIITKMDAIANNKGDELYLPPPSLQETLGILSRLRGINLVSLDTCRATSLSLKASLVGSGGPWPLVSTALDDLGLLLALKETAHYSMAAAFLSRS